MGMATLPSGNRLDLPRKMSATWFALSWVMELRAETTGTTSSAREGRAVARRPKMMNLAIRVIPSSSEDEVDGRAHHAYLATEREAGLHVAERAERSLAQPDLVELQLEGGVAHEVPTHAEGNGGLARQRVQLRVEREVELCGHWLQVRRQRRER